jgi:hypothetical protein
MPKRLAETPLKSTEREDFRGFDAVLKEKCKKGFDRIKHPA